MTITFQRCRYLLLITNFANDSYVQINVGKDLKIRDVLCTPVQKITNMDNL